MSRLSLATNNLSINDKMKFLKWSRHQSKCTGNNNVILHPNRNSKPGVTTITIIRTKIYKMFSKN